MIPGDCFKPLVVIFLALSVRQITNEAPRLRLFQESCVFFRTTRQPTPTNLARRPLSATQAATDDVLLARIAQDDRLAMQVL